MAKDSISKEEKKKLKDLAKEEKSRKKILQQEEKKRLKEEKRQSKEENKRRSKEEKMKSKTNENPAGVRESKQDKMELTKSKSVETGAKQFESSKRTDTFQFLPSRFVMPRGRKGYVFPVTPGPARYPVTRINYPIMNARRQVDLTKRMIPGPAPPSYTMGIRHTEFREFYNKIQ